MNDQDKPKGLYSWVYNYVVGMPTDILSENGLLILSCFFPELEDKASKDLEECSGLSHEPVFRTLKDLVKKEYLKKKNIGKTNVYEFVLTDETYLVFVYFMTNKLNRFKHNNNKVFKIIKEFTGLIESKCAVLFGSYAKGTETSKSDVDLIVVSNNKNVLKTASTFKTKYAVTIRPVMISANDFKNIKKDNIIFYNDMIKYGIVFDGIEFFFKEVYR